MTLPGVISARVVAVIRKTADEEIRVSVITLPNGRRMLDVRLFATNQGAGGVVTATKKGVCFAPELLPELQRAFGDIELAIQSPRGLDSFPG